MPDPLYPFSTIEPKWQKHWQEHKTFRTPDPKVRRGADESADVLVADKKKLYVLDMFPYPSGAGLHVGHPEGYTATDIYSRYKRMQGFNVLHPMGWDAFGLPAEQYAIETGTHPAVTTQKNITTFKKQIQQLGLSYDWDREVDTTDPEYVRWTQWIFLKLFNSYFDDEEKKVKPIDELRQKIENNPKITEVQEIYDELVTDWKYKPASKSFLESYIDRQRLAYIANAPVWWCKELKCVLANEEVIDGKSERGGYPVERRLMRQWMLKIKVYADRLLEDLKLVDWPDSIKEMQKNWIGRSEGALVDFKLAIPGDQNKLDYVIDSPHVRYDQFSVFTTRPDTLFGATYVVLAPEHYLVDTIVTGDYQTEVKEYQKKCASKSDLERTELAKEKTGIFTGSFAINSVNGLKIPIWISDYVLISYGGGAVMAVPAHDQRDYDFAKKFNLTIVEVVKGGDISKKAFTDNGINVKSDFLNGLPTTEAKNKIVEWLEKKGCGKRVVNYKLRDWLFSRQRYWGEPIPIVHCKSCGTVPLPESELPLRLPEVKDFKPSGSAEAPLAKAKEWVKTKCPKCHGVALRETNTMPQWAGSCWYYLRYIDPKNKKSLCDPAKEKYWMPVDLYVGGAEHAVLHLLYSRFWHKVLYDLKFVSTPEPFMKLVNQGMILGEDGQKMSKSRGNVINPDFVVENYGADSMRLYEMFMGPLTQMKSWSMKGIEGVYRFLGRVWRLYVDKEGNLDPRIEAMSVAPNQAMVKLLHRTIKKVTEDVEALGFNTAISAMMICSNELAKEDKKPKAMMESFLLLLSPFAPHLAEELWEKLGHKEGLVYEKWPVYDPKLIEDEVIEIPIMVNGKVKSKISIQAGATESEVEKQVMMDEKILAAIQGKKIQQKKYVPKKIYTIAVS